MTRQPVRPGLVSWLISLLLHAVVIAGLALSAFHEPEFEKPVPMALELWTSAPPPPVDETVVPQTVPVRPKAPAPEVAAPPKADIQLGERTPPARSSASAPMAMAKAPEPKLRPAPRPEPTPEPKPVPAKVPPKTDSKPEPKPAPGERKPATKQVDIPANRGKQTAPRYNADADELLADLGSNNTSRKPNGRSDQPGSANGVMGGSPSGKGVDDSGYRSKVVARIRPLIQIPPDMEGNPSAEVEVTILPTLEVRTIRLIKSSGHAGYDQAVQQAIREARTFPPLPSGADPAEYRRFRLVFRPK